MAIFDFRQASISETEPAILAGVQLFPANSRRVSLIISSNIGSLDASNVNLATAKNASLIWIGTQPPIDWILPYRDYGPIIKQEVWVFANLNVGITLDLFGVEIFAVPQLE